MDKIKKYQKAIINVLKKHQCVAPIDTQREEILVDTIHNHFQLISTGWKEDEYHFHVFVHLHIHNDKIWLLQNKTEWKLADELIAEGVPKQDIVLGFVAPALRAYSGFATA